MNEQMYRHAHASLIQFALSKAHKVVAHIFLTLPSHTDGWSRRPGDFISDNDIALVLKLLHPVFVMSHDAIVFVASFAKVVFSTLMAKFSGAHELNVAFVVSSCCVCVCRSAAG